MVVLGLPFSQRHDLKQTLTQGRKETKSNLLTKFLPMWFDAMENQGPFLLYLTRTSSREVRIRVPTVFCYLSYLFQYGNPPNQKRG